MPSIEIFADIPEADAAMAATFFRDWFGDEHERYAVISQILPQVQSNGRERILNLHQPPSVFREAFESNPNMDDLIYAQDQRWNLYMGVGVLSQVPVSSYGVTRKGGKKDIAYVPGVWVDLDQKPGAFRDEEHALSLLRSVQPWPTIVVATGTGGVHGYWKTDRPLDPQEAEALAEQWWTHLSREAGSDVKIDRLTNCDRIMKLPGSIRWEKELGDRPALVRLLHSSGGTVSLGALETTARAAYTDYRRQAEERRRALSERQLQVQRDYSRMVAARSGGSWGDTTWGRCLALAEQEDEFNNTYSWHQILEPLGWTDIGTDSEGRTIWSRPGLSGADMRKSAATGYQGSHVMSLFSESPETKELWDLMESGVKLTKYRIFVQCVWKGDEAAFLRQRLGL